MENVPLKVETQVLAFKDPNKNKEEELTASLKKWVMKKLEKVNFILCNQC